MRDLKHKQSLANEMRETNNDFKDAHQSELRKKVTEIRVTKAG
jgi:hypothetical protein